MQKKIKKTKREYRYGLPFSLQTLDTTLCFSEKSANSYLGVFGFSNLPQRWNNGMVASVSERMLVRLRRVKRIIAILNLSSIPRRDP